MKTIASIVLIGATAISSAVVLCGCAPISIREKSESAGFNGSFEIARSGLPVNWYFYYSPIKNGGVEISLDTSDAIEGNQSLKLVSRRVERVWKPGFFQVLPAKSESSYRVSFWLKSQGCSVSLMLNSEKPKEAPPAIRRALNDEEIGAGTWRKFEYIYTVPESYENIRFELNIIQPGTLWIDDVRIEEVRNG